MALKEHELFGIRDKVAIAIMRIKEFEPMAIQNNPNGYYVCISGGKDSSVIQELCIMAGVKCEFVYSHTSVDHPETIYFIREEQQRLNDLGYTFRTHIPRWDDGRQKTMWNMIPIKGLPTRRVRWCCQELKENSGKNRYCITGVRWAESVARKKNRKVHEVVAKMKNKRELFNNDNDMRRKLTEICLLKRSFILNPIIDWSDYDVWDFLRKRKVPVNPLYKKGYKRIGCIGCTMSTNAKKILDGLPKYKAAYQKAAKRYWEHKKKRADCQMDGVMETPETYFEWWLRG
jgi:phosphoadenosine phosphosulfate reductase